MGILQRSQPQTSTRQVEDEVVIPNKKVDEEEDTRRPPRCAFFVGAQDHS